MAGLSKLTHAHALRLTVYWYLAGSWWYQLYQQFDCQLYAFSFYMWINAYLNIFFVLEPFLYYGYVMLNLLAFSSMFSTKRYTMFRRFHVSVKYEDINIGGIYIYTKSLSL